VPFRLVLFDCCFKAVTRDQLENLAEDTAYSFHGEVSSVNGFVLGGTEPQTTRGFTSSSIQQIWTKVFGDLLILLIQAEHLNNHDGLRGAFRLAYHRNCRRPLSRKALVIGAKLSFVTLLRIVT
jgi:hypothetical protein